jgi:hypothetical protein
MLLPGKYTPTPILNSTAVKGNPRAAVELLPCDHEVMSSIQILEIASCRNAGKGCVNKTQSGRTFPLTLWQAGATCTGLPCFNLLMMIVTSTTLKHGILGWILLNSDHFKKDLWRNTPICSEKPNYIITHLSNKGNFMQIQIIFQTGEVGGVIRGNQH